MSIELARNVLKLQGKTIEEHSCYNCVSIYTPDGKCFACKKGFTVDILEIKTGPFKSQLPMRPESCNDKEPK